MQWKHHLKVSGKKIYILLISIKSKGNIEINFIIIL